MVEYWVPAMRCAGRRVDCRIIVYPVFPANDGGQRRPRIA